MTDHKDSKEKSVISYYNQYSSNYNNFYMSIQFQKFEELSNLIELPFSSWVIDLGGGTGLLSNWFKFPILTIDISENMLRKGLMSSETDFLAVCGDMQALPIRSNSIDTIYSITAIQNCSNPLLAIEELSRISKPDIHGIITVLAKKINPEIEITLRNYFIEIEKFNLEIEDIAYYFTYKISALSSSSSGSKSS